MWKTSAAAAVLVTAISIRVAAAPDDAKKVIDEASKAMGIVGLNSITYAGGAAAGNWGQSRTISFGLASTSIKNYVRTIDFVTPASRAAGDAQPPALVRGGPLPPATKYNQTESCFTSGQVREEPNSSLFSALVSG